MLRVALLMLACLLPAWPEPQASLPRRSPEFAFQVLGGKQMLLTQFRGRVVALEFLYTTCPHCQHTAQLMTRFQKEYGPRGFQALGVAFNEMANMLVPEFIAQSSANYPIGWGQREAVLQYLQISPILRFVVPQMVILDRKGFIRAQSPYDGGDNFFEEKNLRTLIEGLLKESPPPRQKK